MKIKNAGDLKALRNSGRKKLLPDRPRLAVGYDTCGLGNGAKELHEALAAALKKRKADVYLTKTGCFGFCAEEPFVNVYLPGQPLLVLHRVALKDVETIVDYVVKKPGRGSRDGRELMDRLVFFKIEEWDHLTTEPMTYGAGLPGIPRWNEVPFFKWQKKIVLRNSGIINPEDIEEYFAVGGYAALFKVLQEMSPDQALDEVKRSKLRGRGGAGFPTGVKWEMLKKATADEKYLIVNADEGDPGAYMNRNEIESDPHMLIEGLIIGGYIMGAHQALIYARAEYPLAVARLKKALAEAEAHGLLGKNIMGSKFDFQIQVVEGAGAFVCGEETALVASIEGKPGRPVPRPPFPAEKGLWGKPTNINNVETWCNIPVIIAKGGEWLTKTGTPKSAGTKVFSLVGKIKNTGLVELPLGTTLETLVFKTGGGSQKAIKAVQTGGPSGGCVPVKLFNTPVDYESLNALGTIMGSGGMVVLDEDNCMVDVANYFLEFTVSESCGKCTPCREGLAQALNDLKKITKGQGKPEDLAKLESLGQVIRDTALCGLGQTGPNPVITTMKYFRNEYEDHLRAKRCPAGVCQDLFRSPCENSCPLHMNIPGYLELLKENRLDEAYELVLRENPLPASLGRICLFHCQSRCRRQDIDAPVAPGEVHRYIADTVFKKKRESKALEVLNEEKMPRTHKKIAVIGGGPAGLTAAFYLVRLGHEVTVYEASDRLGGVLQHGIPEYRLPKTVLNKEIGLIEELGVKTVKNIRIGKDLSLASLEAKHDAVFLATGADKETKGRLPGEDLKGVLPGLYFLWNAADKRTTGLGQKVLVIGGGNVALDAARTAWRLGANVTIVYRREEQDMPANLAEIAEAHREGVKFVFLAAPKAILADKSGRVKALEVTRMQVGELDLSGRRQAVPTEETYQIAADTVIMAIGEKVDAEWLKKSGLKTNDNGTVAVDRYTYQTSQPKIFAAGDLVTGPATAAEVMGAAKLAAAAIDKYLTGKDRFAELAGRFHYQNAVPKEPAGGARKRPQELPVQARRRNFREVNLGFKAVQALAEAERCLRCDVKEGNL